MSARAGWYPTPEGRERFWNGERWTDQFRDAAFATGPPGPGVTQQVQPGTSVQWLPVLGWFARHWIVSIILLIFVVGSIGSLFESSDGSPASAKDKTSSPQAAASADETETAQEEPKTKLEQLQEAVDVGDVGDPRAKLDGRVAEVVFDVRDNFSDSTIRTGIARDVFAMAEAISKTDVKVKEVAFRGMFPLIDKYGNEEPGQVFYTTLRGSDLPKIQYDQIMVTTFENLSNLAIQGIVVLHPDFR